MAHHLAYLWEENILEIKAGLIDDLAPYTTPTTNFYTFSTEEELFIALQPFRHQGKIITIVSPLKKLCHLWNT